MQSLTETTFMQIGPKIGKNNGIREVSSILTYKFYF